MRALIIGSKEYPLGTNKGEDPVSSGGMEYYVGQFVNEITKNKDIKIKIITRKFEDSKKFERSNHLEIYRVPWIKGVWFRGPSFNFFSFIKTLFLKFDIILANGPMSTFFGNILAKIKRKPIIAIPHGLAYSQPQYGIFKGLLKYLEKKIYSKSDYVIAFSDQDKNKLKEFSHENNLRIIPSAIDPRLFHNVKKNKILKEFKISNKTKIISFIGRLNKVKAVDSLLKAVSKIKDESFKVLIVGNGPEEENLKQLSTDLDLSDKVIFTDYRKDIPEILAATDIFVLTSLSEGMPIVLLEAMASNCACVVTDIGLPVKHNKTALIVPVKDPNTLAKKISLLIKNDKLRNKLKKNALDYSKEFTWKKCIKKYVDLLKKINYSSDL